jgi:membrane protease YdiL (CAAX protease family)
MTEITSGAAAADATAHRPCKPWGFWATTGFGLTAIVVWFAFQMLAAVLVLAWLGIGVKATDFEVNTLASHALTISIATIVSMPAAIAVVTFAARLAGCTAVEYLALRRPARSDLMLGILAVAVLLPLGDLSSWLTGRDLVPPAVVDAYRTARASGILPLLAIALVIAAPLMEELLFRGFLFRGYVASWLGLAGTVLLTSAGWAAMHIQYELFYIVQIFVLGCALGWLRWRSGSTVLTIVLHALVNAIALAQVAWIVERAA